jgi:hypothetical protein
MIFIGNEINVIVQVGLIIYICSINRSNLYYEEHKISFNSNGYILVLDFSS